MARRMDLLNKITRQLSILACEIELMNRSNRMTLNSDAETIFCGLINRLEGWNLGNLNEVAQNYPGIDLADPVRRVAVQITASNTQKKVDHTLTVFFKNKMERNFDRVIIVIITDKPAPTLAHGVPVGFKFDAKRDIWNIEWFKRRVESVEDAELLQAIADYLDSQLGDLPGDVKRPAHLLPPVPGLSEAFLPGSRDRELERLEKALGQGKPVFIWGLGGMGKTQTAIALANRCAPPRGAYFLRYTLPDDPAREAMWETIRQADLSGYALDAGTETDPDVLMEREYREKLEILRREYADTLLVIDNFDCPGKSILELKVERSYRDVAALESLGVSLVFTTRYPADPDWEIRPLSEDRLLELMRKSCADHTDEQLLALIRAVGGHTLMVDLMAKTLEESWNTVTPEQLLEALKDATLNIADFPAVASDKDGLFAQAQIYKHLLALFNLSGLTAAAKTVLGFATFIAREGLDDTLFLESLPAAEKKELQNLCKRGWLRREDHVITIHPAVLQVCRGELKPEEADVQAFLDQLWERREKRKCSDQTLRRVALCLTEGGERLRDRAEVFTCKKRAMEIWEQILPDDHPELAAVYSAMGMVYNRMGENEMALQYTTKAMTIKRNILPADHPDLAKVYENMGRTLADLDQYAGAIRYQLAALAIWEKVLPEDHLDLAASCHDIAMNYLNKRMFRKALEYQLRAMEIRERNLPRDHAELAQSYGGVGKTYYYLREYDTALEYQRKALAIRQRTLPPDHSNLAFSYNDCAETCFEKRDFSQALSLYEKALAIWQAALPEGHFMVKSAAYRIEQLREILSEE